MVKNKNEIIIKFISNFFKNIKMIEERKETIVTFYQGEEAEFLTENETRNGVVNHGYNN